MTAVEFLAERYNYINWLRNRDEISAGKADEWRAKFLKEAKEMELQQLNKARQEGAVKITKWYKNLSDVDRKYVDILRNEASDESDYFSQGD